MDIVGLEHAAPDEGDVHTIDIWYSRRRGCWIVERLNGAGEPVGAAHCCASEEDAEACLSEWLRAHGETHLTVPRGGRGARDGDEAQEDVSAEVIRLADRSRAA